MSLLDELEALVAANAALLGLEPVAVREALQGQGQAKGAPGGLREELMRRDTEAKKKWVACVHVGRGEGGEGEGVVVPICRAVGEG